MLFQGLFVESLHGVLCFPLIPPRSIPPTSPSIGLSPFVKTLPTPFSFTHLFMAYSRVLFKETFYCMPLEKYTNARTPSISSGFQRECTEECRTSPPRMVRCGTLP